MSSRTYKRHRIRLAGARNRAGTGIAAVVAMLCLAVSTAPAADGFWGAPEPLGAPVNSLQNELSGVLCPAGARLFFTRTVAGQNDLFVADREGDGFGRPTPLLAINSPLYHELNLTFGADGTHIYFVTDRPGGPGGFDIWTSTWDGQDWTPPVPLSGAVNTAGDDWYAAEAPEGLYISARTTSGPNRGDIFLAAGSYPEFAARAPVVPLATSQREMSAFPAPDGQALYLTADYAGSVGLDDIWVSFRGESGWQPPLPLKCDVNGPDFDQYPAIGADGKEMIFASFDRPGGLGGADLYRCRWHTQGDINADGASTLADIIFLVKYLFGKGPAPLDPMVDDLNCDAATTLVDVVELINYVLRAGARPCNPCLP